MNYSIRSLTFLMLFFILQNCSTGDGPRSNPMRDCITQTPTSSTIHILPLGDSRVEGARPFFESYRYELWKLLLENKWEVDFIGTRTDQSDYPAFQGICFDNDHEGTGGATTKDILATLENPSLMNPPKVVLLGIGGNDLLDSPSSPAEVAENLEKIIVRLQQEYTGVIIFLEQIALVRTDIMTAKISARIEAFNVLVSELAEKRTTKNAPIIAIDMFSGWSDAYLADEVHYNEAGAKKVAERYYQAIMENVEK